MRKKAIFILVIIIIFTFFACNYNDNEYLIGKIGPLDRKMGNSDVTETLTIYIYHNDSYVTKTIMEESFMLAENGNIDDLKSYSEAVQETFNLGMFQVEGFKFSSELGDSRLINKTVIDYTKVSVDEISEDVKEFFYGKELNLIDEDYNVIYDKVLETYTKLGFVFEEEE